MNRHLSRQKNPQFRNLFHSIPITTTMRESVMHGQPLFQTQIAPGNNAWDIRGNLIQDQHMTPQSMKLICDVDALLEKIAPGAKSAGFRSITANGEEVYGLHIPPKWSLAGHVIAWSLDSPEAIGTARHEAIHYLRQTGLIKPKEWAALTRAAEEQGWADRYQIRRRYADLPYERQVEEAIAERFSEWRRNPDYSGDAKMQKLSDERAKLFRERGETPPGGLVARTFYRMREILDRVAALTRAAFGKEATAKDIMDAIDRGVMGARDRGEQEHALNIARLAQEEDNQSSISRGAWGTPTRRKRNARRASRKPPKPHRSPGRRCAGRPMLEPASSQHRSRQRSAATGSWRR